VPSLDDNTLVFRFPKTEQDASVSITFMRTLRIPDTEQHYNLPPGLGHFPLRHTEDYAKALPRQTTDRGGVILPKQCGSGLKVIVPRSEFHFQLPSRLRLEKSMQCQANRGAMVCIACLRITWFVQDNRG